jgi:hypothetical protein
MVYQRNSNGLVAYKKQAGLGTPASGSSASLLRLSGGNGIKLSKAAIASAEVRNDGMSTRGRHGTQSIAAAYNAELSLGALDPIIEAIMRSTWDSSAFAKTQADFTSLTTAVDGFIFASGNPITMGLKRARSFELQVCPMQRTMRATSVSLRCHRPRSPLPKR